MIHNIDAMEKNKNRQRRNKKTKRNRKRSQKTETGRKQITKRKYKNNPRKMKKNVSQRKRALYQRLLSRLQYWLHGSREHPKRRNLSCILWKKLIKPPDFYLSNLLILLKLK